MCALSERVNERKRECKNRGRESVQHARKGSRLTEHYAQVSDWKIVVRNGVCSLENEEEKFEKPLQRFLAPTVFEAWGF